MEDASTNQLLPKNGIFFGGCAWGCAYYIGTIRAAREKWVNGADQIQTHIPVGGSSAGAMMALGVALDRTESEMYQLYHELMTQARQHGVVGRMSHYHQAVLDRWLPLGGSEYVHLMQSGRLHIGITQFPATPMLVGTWSSNQHMHEILHASFHIPVYCEHDVIEHAMDGAIVQSFWKLPSVQTTWTVSPIELVADICPISPIPPMQIIWPMTEPDISSNIELGYRDFMRLCDVVVPKGHRQCRGSKNSIYTMFRYLALIVLWTLFYGRRYGKRLIAIYIRVAEVVKKLV